MSKCILNQQVSVHVMICPHLFSIRSIDKKLASYKHSIDLAIHFYSTSNNISIQFLSKRTKECSHFELC